MVYFLRQLASVLLLPFSVTVLVPLWLLGSGPVGWIEAPLAPVRMVVGVTSGAIGLALFASTLLHFVRVGRGTLAPWDPPRELVVVGVYRRVRNPMISGVVFVLLAEALLTGSARLFEWFGLFALVNAIYIPLVEEPGLERRFGERYREYRRNVPRWIPRSTSWLPPWDA